MNTAIVTPGKLVIGRRSLGGLIVGIAAASAVAGGLITATAIDRDSATSSRPEWQSDEHVTGVLAASPEELAAAFGNVPFDPDAARSDAFVAGVLAASREELAATFG